MTALIRAILYYSLTDKLAERYIRNLQQDLNMIKHHKENYTTVIPPDSDYVTKHYKYLNKQ